MCVCWEGRQGGRWTQLHSAKAGSFPPVPGIAPALDWLLSPWNAVRAVRQHHTIAFWLHRGCLLPWALAGPRHPTSNASCGARYLPETGPAKQQPLVLTATGGLPPGTTLLHIGNAASHHSQTSPPTTPGTGPLRGREWPQPFTPQVSSVENLGSRCYFYLRNYLLFHAIFIVAYQSPA